MIVLKRLDSPQSCLQKEELKSMSNVGLKLKEVNASSFFVKQLGVVSVVYSAFSTRQCRHYYYKKQNDITTRF